MSDAAMAATMIPVITTVIRKLGQREAGFGVGDALLSEAAESGDHDRSLFITSRCHDNER